MNEVLIKKSDVVAIIENKRLMVKHDLPTEYKLAEVQEEIEKLSFSYNLEQVIRELELQTEIARQRHDGSAVTAFTIAINIVKRGGLKND